MQNLPHRSVVNKYILHIFRTIFKHGITEDLKKMIPTEEGQNISGETTAAQKQKTDFSVVTMNTYAPFFCH